MAHAETSQEATRHRATATRADAGRATEEDAQPAESVDEPGMRIRRDPRLFEYARRVAPVPKMTAKNAALAASLMAIKCVLVASIYAGNTPATIVSALLMCGWCCCPWCAIERELRSAVEVEAAPLMEDGDDAA